jgi:hypothetical protein
MKLAERLAKLCEKYRRWRPAPVPFSLSSPDGMITKASNTDGIVD